MARSKDARRVPKSAFNDLYRRLRVFWVTGALEDSAYVLGVHVLAKMARYDTLEITASWSEFACSVVSAGSEVVVGPVTPNRFFLLGAVQQLHSTVGLLSHLHQDGIEQSIAEARSNGGIAEHFSKLPGPASNIVGMHTLLIFRFEQRCGYDEERVLEMFREQTSVARMPSWVRAVPSGS